MHPLSGNLSEFTITELEDKLNALSAKYYMVHDADMRFQMIMLIDSYRAELEHRRNQNWKKQNKLKNVMLDKLINIS